jgi:hypothetical protein
VKDLRFAQYRRQVLKRLPESANRPDNLTLMKCYARGLNVRGAVLFLS